MGRSECSWADVLQGARQRFGAGPSGGQGRGGLGWRRKGCDKIG